MCGTFFRRFFGQPEIQTYSIYLILNKDLFFLNEIYKAV